MNMKHLKTFENLIIDFMDKKKALNKEKQKIIDLLDEFFQLNKERWKNWEIEFESITVVDFEVISGYDILNIVYKENSEKIYYTLETTIMSSDVKDFLEFSENPELYKSARKYNL